MRRFLPSRNAEFVFCRIVHQKDFVPHGFEHFVSCDGTNDVVTELRSIETMIPREPLPYEFSTCRIEFKNRVETSRTHQKPFSIGRELNCVCLIQPRVLTKFRLTRIHVDQLNMLSRG